MIECVRHCEFLVSVGKAPRDSLMLCYGLMWRITISSQGDRLLQSSLMYVYTLRTNWAACRVHRKKSDFAFFRGKSGIFMELCLPSASPIGGSRGGGASRQLLRDWYNRYSYQLTASEGGFLSKLRLDRSCPWFTVMETDRVHLEFYHVRSNTLFGSEGLYVPLTRNSRTN